MIYQSEKPEGWTTLDPVVYIPELEAIDQGLDEIQHYFPLNNAYQYGLGSYNLAVLGGVFMETTKAWIFVGNYNGVGQSMYTFDGQTATVVTSGIEDWDAIAYGNGHVVANIRSADTSNKFKESTTLGGWFTRNVGYTLAGDCRSLFYSERLGIFVASSDNGHIDTSPAGVTWTAGTVDTEWTSNLAYATNFAENKDIIVGVGNNNTTFIYSTDGVIWKTYPAPELANFRISYNNELQLFMAVGGPSFTTWVSGDGLNWFDLVPAYENATNPNFKSLVSFGPVFVGAINTVFGVRGLVFNNIKEKRWQSINAIWPDLVFYGGGQLVYTNTVDTSLAFSLRSYVSPEI